MKLFLGLIFILLDFKFEVGPSLIGLLPDFIGCWLVMRALDERSDAWRHGAFALGLVSLVLYAADLVPKGTMAQIGFTGANLLAQIGMLTLLYHVVRPVSRLRELFPVVACVRVLCGMLAWIPLVGTVCTVANAVVSVCFLIAAYQPLVKGR